MASRLAALQTAQPTAAPPAEADKAAAVVVEEDPLEKGFRLVEAIQSGTRDLQNKTAEVRLKGEDVQRSADPKSDGTLGALQASMDETNKISQKVKRNLDSLKMNIGALKKAPGGADGADDAQAIAGNADVIRIQENQLQHHTQQFIAAMNEYNAVVRTNEKAIQEQVKARIKLKYTNEKGCTMSDAQLTELAQDFIELEQESARLTNAKVVLGTIMENRQDYLKMARSMRELGQLYTDLASLLSEQSVLMDQIHENFTTANNYVEDGRKKLSDAKGYAKKNRKCMLWAFVLIGIIFFFVLAVVLGFSV